MTTPTPTACLGECDDRELLQELRRRGYARLSALLTKPQMDRELARLWRVQKAVADEFGVELRTMKTKGRGKREQAEARQIAMVLAHELTMLSMVDIGVAFGWRDHSTVVHAIGAVEHRCANDPDLRKRLADLRALLR